MNRDPLSEWQAVKMNKNQRNPQSCFPKREVENQVSKRGVGIIAAGLLLLAAFLSVIVVLGSGTATAAQSDALPHNEAQATNPHLFIQQTPRLQEIFPGGNATFNVTIQNTGNVPLTNISVTNGVATDCNRNSLGPLQPGAQTSYPCGLNGVSESFLNVITAEGTVSGSSQSVTKQSDAFVKVLKPDIRILKRPITQTVTRGGTANFVITVSNISNNPPVVLLNLKITDPLAPDCSYNDPLTLGPDDSLEYPCKATNVQSAFTGVATASATVLGGGDVSDSDAGWVELLDLSDSIASAPTSVAEPGDLVVFTIVVHNTGSVPVTLKSLDTNKFGNAMNPANPLILQDGNSCLPAPSLPVLAPSGGRFECSFTALVSGQPSNFSVILTAVAEAQGGAVVNATTNTTVFITNVPSSLTVNVTATPPLIPEPGGQVSYSVLLLNTSEVDAIQILSLNDSRLGSLDGKGTCNVPTPLIAAGSSYQCEFTDNVSGTVGQQVNRSVTANGINDDQTSNQVSGSDTSSVSIVELPPQLVFIANVADDVVEPNNKCSTAYPLQLDYQYYFFAEDRDDVYSFTLANKKAVTVELTNFVPLAGQLLVWKGECGELEFVGYNPDTSLNKTLNLGSLDPDSYIVHVVNAGPMNRQDPYGLILR